MSVMDQDIVLRNSALTDGDDLELFVYQDETLVPVLSENHPLTMSQNYRAVSFDFFVGDLAVRAVIVDDTIDKHLCHGASVVFGGSHENLLIQLQLRIYASCKECAACAHYEGTGIEGMLHGSVRGCLGNLAEGRCRGILTFCQSVDTVVEQDDVDVDITPDGVDEMVAADTVACQIDSVGLATFMPVEMAVARPWIPWKPYVFM